MFPPGLTFKNCSTDLEAKELERKRVLGSAGRESTMSHGVAPAVPSVPNPLVASQQALGHPGSLQGGFPSSSPAEGLQEMLQSLHLLV